MDGDLHFVIVIFKIFSIIFVALYLHLFYFFLRRDILEILNSGDTPKLCCFRS